MGSRAVIVSAFIVEITARIVLRSDTPAEQLPADIYSHVTEFIRNEEDILDLGVEVFELPADLGGSSH